MPFEVIISKEAFKEIKALPEKIQSKIYDVIFLLSGNPYPTTSKKLQKVDAYRLRVGDYRIIYIIEKKVLRIVVVRVNHRKDIYK